LVVRGRRDAPGAAIVVRTAPVGGDQGDRQPGGCLPPPAHRSSVSRLPAVAGRPHIERGASFVVPPRYPSASPSAIDHVPVRLTCKPVPNRGNAKKVRERGRI